MLELNVFPPELQQIIAIYASEVSMPYKFAEWVEDDILEKVNLLRFFYNNRAVEVLLQNRQRASEVIFNKYGRFYRCSIYDELITFLLIQNSKSTNPFDIDPKSVDWGRLSSEPKAIAYLLKFPALIAWTDFCRNTAPAAIQFISENMDKISRCWFYLSTNPAAVGILAANLNKVDWFGITQNTSPEAIRLISENLDKISNWYYLSANPAAAGILAANLNKVDWARMSLNPSPITIEILKTHLDLVQWNYVAQNTSTAPALFELLELGFEHMNWSLVSANKYAIKFLEAHLDMIDFSGLSSNEAAVHILKNNMNKLDYRRLSENPALFEPDMPLYYKRVFQMFESLE